MSHAAGHRFACPPGAAADGASGTVVVIAGPTASGKSGLAVAVARAFDGVVINADSMQVYAELKVLTARPGAAEEAAAPHRLYGHMPAAAACSAGLWRRQAMGEIAGALAAGKLPIVVGGTGLYLHALLHSLAPVPEIPAALRTAARRLHDELGGAEFHRRLARRDPAGAARLRPSDRQRLIRAYEVIEATGRSLAEWQRRQGPALTWPAAVVRLDPPRAELYRRCDERFQRMVADGALAEVAALLALGLAPALPAMKAVGVRELAAHLAGSASLESAIAAGQRATRRYAKRQTTWFRSRLSDNIILNLLVNEKLSERFKDKIYPFIEEYLLTARKMTG